MSDSMEQLYCFEEDFEEQKSQNRLNLSMLSFFEQFSLALKSNHLDFKDDVGYLKTINQDIYFGRRYIRSVENNINLSYFFDSKKWINLRLRNYWSRAKIRTDSVSTKRRRKTNRNRLFNFRF